MMTVRAESAACAIRPPHRAVDSRHGVPGAPRRPPPIVCSIAARRSDTEIGSDGRGHRFDTEIGSDGRGHRSDTEIDSDGRGDRRRW
ncbi:hypothetical protein GCM10010234_51280 [Streptomyces hawaiiensis]